MLELIVIVLVIAGILLGYFVRMTDAVHAYTALATLVGSLVLIKFGQELAESTGVTITLWGYNLETHYQTFFLGLFGVSASLSIMATNAAGKLLTMLDKDKR